MSGIRSGFVIGIFIILGFLASYQYLPSFMLNGVFGTAIFSLVILVSIFIMWGDRS